MKSNTKFKSFHETFKYVTFGMALANIYPNTSKGHARKRAIIYICFLLFCSIQCLWVLAYTIKCFVTSDLFNFVRNFTLWIIVYLFILKTFYAIWYTSEFAAILNIITKDHLVANDMEEDYKEIYDVYLKKCINVELVWTVVPILLCSQYPLTAVFYTIYETLQSDLGHRYMVHEINLLYLEDIQYTSPFYEIHFVYVTIISIIFTPIFVGFGGSFSIASYHLCLKLKLVTHKVERAFKEAKDNVELLSKMKEAITDHQGALKFFEDMQNFYGLWLLNRFLVESILISLNLYLMHLLGHFDLKYCIFTLTIIVESYLPCASASAITEMAQKSAWDLYCVPWEMQRSPSITKMLTFMIARTQQSMVFSGKGIVDYNMELFVSMMKFAYSFYTLLAS